jgi:hypothetical protein
MAFLDIFMASNHFIFDYETFGQDMQKCAVIDCSYIVFDWDRFTSNNPYTFEELLSDVRRDKFDVKDQVARLGYKVEKNSLEWWSQQTGNARSLIKPSELDISVETHLDNLVTYLSDFSSIKYWWSRSNTFDPIILWRLIENYHAKQHITDRLAFWKIRDTRTFIDAKTNFNLKKNAFTPMVDEQKWERVFEQHNSSHDIIADILRMQMMIRLDNDLPQAE